MQQDKLVKAKFAPTCDQTVFFHPFNQFCIDKIDHSLSLFMPHNASPSYQTTTQKAIGPKDFLDLRAMYHGWHY